MFVVTPGLWRRRQRHWQTSGLTARSALERRRSVSLLLSQFPRQQCLVSGADVYVSALNWDVPVPEGPKYTARVWKTTIDAWSESFSIPPDSRGRSHQRAEELRQSDPKQVSSDEYKRYSDQCRKVPGSVVAPRDGDVRRRTIRSVAGIMLGILALLLTNPDKYRILPRYSPRGLSEFLELSALHMLPRRLLWNWRDTWQVKALPYFYSYQKSSCYPRGVLKCDKSHCHEREHMQQPTGIRILPPAGVRRRDTPGTPRT